MKIIIAILVNLSIFISLPVFAQSTFKNKGKRASLVNVTKVKYFDVAEKTESIGRLVAINPIIISSKINQEILKIHFKIGDNVKKNDVLFTLDSKNILRNIEQISAEMKYEKESLDILEKKLSLRFSKVQNAKNLKKKNIITQDNLDGINILLLDNQQQIAQKKYNIKRLEILLRENKENLSFAKILSPIDGNVVKIDAQVGALTSKGKILALILNTQFKEIETHLRSDLASEVKIGSKVDIFSKKAKFFGKVRGIVNKENVRTGTRKLRISLNEDLPNNINASGTRFSLYIPFGDVKPRLLIPKDALIPSANKKIVYIFDKGIAKQKFIQSGVSIGDKIEVIKGLEEGQFVVVKGNESLRPNQAIEIKRKKN
jgi:RND family efflux transporter MFP subunit